MKGTKNDWVKKIEGATARQRLRPLLLGRKVFEAFRLNPSGSIDLAIFSGKRNLEASLWKAVHGCEKRTLRLMPERHAALVKVLRPFPLRLWAEEDLAQITQLKRKGFRRKPGRRMRPESSFREFTRRSG